MILMVDDMIQEFYVILQNGSFHASRKKYTSLVQTDPGKDPLLNGITDWLQY